MHCVAIGLPVTALDVRENLILAGEGPYVHAYDQSVGEIPRSSCKVLDHQVIHGIRKGHGCTFAVFGQKAINFISIEPASRSISVLCNVHEVSDWIWDVCWLRPSLTTNDAIDLSCLDLSTHDLSPHDDHQGKWKGPSPASSAYNTSVAIATGHNAVLLWDTTKMCVMNTVYCQENCILYCAKFIGQNWSDLVLAAGTVFNQVVFWRPQGPRDATGRVVVDQRFKGHQGVIFDITYNAELGLLATVSDDRSIRLWRYQHPFKDNVDRSKEAERVLYGHSARVWSAQILSDKIVSVGEDATCCIWNMDGEIVKKFKSHKGKSIWSLAVQRDGLFVVTGGGDSSIRRWSLKGQQLQAPADTATWDIQRDVKTLLADQHDGVSNNHVIDADLVPRTLTISSNGLLLVMTQGGYLFSWSNVLSSYHLVKHDVNYRSYSVIASAPSIPLVAMGNIHGSIKVISVDQHSTNETEVKAYGSSVVNVTWASNEDLFSTGIEGQLTWWKVRRSPSLAVLSPAHFTLPPCKQRWATSVALLRENQFVCGDRRGSVHLYQFNHTQNERPGPSSSVPGIHGKSGTSFVCLHGGSVYSAGRDGTYRQYYITDEGDIRLENTHKVHKGFEWLEKLVFTEDGDIHVLGFHSVNFVVWSVLNNEAVVTVPCGGGHRAWNLSPLDDGSMTFVCIKMKQLLVHSVSSVAWQQQTILKDDIHGREITCIKFLRTVQIADQSHHICATGSEDSKVNIVTFSSIKPNLDCPPPLLGDIKVLHRLHSHVSSVRALAHCPSSSSVDETLLFSVGGRYSINCWKVKFSSEVSNVAWTKQICSVRHLVSHSSLTSTRSRQKLRQQEKLLDPETRFMDVSVWRRGVAEGLSHSGIGASRVMICVASSDALVRFFYFDEFTCKITPLGSSNMHNCCLLCVNSLTFDPKVKEAVNPRMLLVSGGTDGHIAVWNVQGAESLADKLALDASKYDNDDEGEGTKDDNEEDGEKEEVCAADKGRDNVNIKNWRSKLVNVKKGMEIYEPKGVLGERRKIKEDVVLPQYNYDDDVPSSTAGIASSMSTSEDKAQPDTHVSWTERRQGLDAVHQDSSSSSIDSSPDTTDRCLLDYSVPTSTGIPESSASIASQAILPLGDATNWSSSSVEGHAQSLYIGHERLPLNQEEMPVISRETPAIQVTYGINTGRDTRSIGQLMSSWCAHQSGINAISIQYVNDGRYVIVSGGDDNAITVTLLDPSCLICNETMTQDVVLDMYKIPTAHSTQVTGIQFISPDHTFLSVSVDQRLNQWRVKLSPGSLKIEEVRMVASSFVHVSDAAGLETWHERSTDVQYAVICGQSLQLIYVKKRDEGII